MIYENPKNNLTSIKLELGINAQKMIQQVHFQNEFIEEELEKGIKMAFDEMLSNDRFHLIIKEQTIKTVEDIVSSVVLNWEFKNKIKKIIEQKISDKIEAYSEKIAEQVTKNLI